jgi:hypothetical protein
LSLESLSRRGIIIRSDVEGDRRSYPYASLPQCADSGRESQLVNAVRYLALVCIVGALAPLGAVADEPDDPPQPTETSDPWQDLGVGESQIDLERSLIKDQVRTFIPPLLRGSTPIHAFTLPPGINEIGLTARFLSVDGDDFFLGGEENGAVFRDSRVDRQLFDLSMLHGFDFRRKYLHNFTAFLNIPFLSSSVEGSIHPNGMEKLSIMNRGSTQAMGDISLIIKKKIVDQANFPFGVAAAVGVFFPTGSNDELFGRDGLVDVLAPALPGGPPIVGEPIPKGVLGFSPPAVGPFPFNGGVFDRFGDEGRLPSVLQAGDGTASFLVGGFLTRQFLPGDLRGLSRAALHFGTTHRFHREADGVDRGDLNTHQLSFVFPIRKDYLALEVGYLGFYQFEDHYDGTHVAPFFTDSEGNDASESASTHVTFKEVDRSAFTRGEWGNLVTSLIVSPDPQIRFVGTVLTRVVEPNLGPAPPYVFRFSLQTLF